MVERAKEGCETFLFFAASDGSRFFDAPVLKTMNIGGRY